MSALEPLRDDAAYVFHYPRKFLWDKPTTPAQEWRDMDVYLHVPFCRAICTYCTFERRVHSKAGMEAFVSGLKQEVALRADRDDFTRARLRSIYMGGGTASLLRNDVIAWFLEAVRALVPGTVDALECTLECEPTNKRRSDYARLHAAGVNRVSIGAQTFSDPILKALNRAHSADQTIRTVEEAQSAGVPTVHLDLMYGLPGQTVAQWRSDLRTAASLGVAHVSAYQLIVFEKEMLDRSLLDDPEARLPGREALREMRQATEEILAGAGYERYSLTEWGRDGARCTYVIGNWKGHDYLGFGPAAYSRNGRWLWENDVLLTRYARRLAAGELPVRAIEMTREQEAARDLAMGLCLLRVDLDDIDAKAGAPCADDFAPTIARLVDQELLWVDGRTIGLTEKGRVHATHAMHTFPK
ncbi:MAG: coproporphyrinogen-III oxidase family protein [Salinarimonas sp.]